MVAESNTQKKPCIRHRQLSHKRKPKPYKTKLSTQAQVTLEISHHRGTTKTQSDIHRNNTRNNISTNRSLRPRLLNRDPLPIAIINIQLVQRGNTTSDSAQLSNPRSEESAIEPALHRIDIQAEEVPIANL